MLRDERLKIIYDEKRWRLLNQLRAEAIELMDALNSMHIFSIVHGSIARGDVTEKSDIDIFIPDVIPSFLVETALERAGISISERILVQATPTYSIKAYIGIDERRSVSFPLSKLRKTEREFYKFGGEATLEMLRRGVRVPGVDKRLMIIEPTEDGHIESSILGREGEVAKLLGISIETVLDRVRTLTRRDKIGRTGLFIERRLASNETFELVLKELAERNPAVRRRLRTV
ncbi:nucleotidyltransferase domain-containing protein [Candidatus Bathyarchaeota archaeon]|nr:nucleotidyltransferase domain-containing protein [Candidatus Bathyarchaeota archaeon]